MLLSSVILFFSFMFLLAAVFMFFPFSLFIPPSLVMPMLFPFRLVWVVDFSVIRMLVYKLCGYDYHDFVLS